MLTKAKGTMKDEYMFFRDVLEEEKDIARATGLAEGIEKGRAEGLSEGSKNNQIETARRLLKENCDIEFISKITDLSKEEIEKLA